MTVTLFLVTTATSAQRTQDIEDWMSSLISKAIDNKVGITKSLGQKRDIQQAGTPLIWRSDIYQFTLPKKQRALLDEMVKAFEANGHDNPNCYSINSMSESSNGNTFGHSRNLMIGEDPNRYVTIGQDYNNFLNINILDVADSTKTHRYAYALEWREAHKGAVDVRYIVTYAKIPPATTTITQPSWPIIDLGRARVNKNKVIQIPSKAQQAPNKARVWYLGKEYPVDSLHNIVLEAQAEADKQRAALVHAHKVLRSGNSIVAWNDTLNHEYDPVTDVIVRLNTGQSVTSDDLLCNDNILLVFSQLKQQLLAGQNTEFNAISIYTLCKRAREYGFFTDSNAKAELEQLKRDIVQMKSKSRDDTLRNYLQMAYDELEKIQ